MKDEFPANSQRSKTKPGPAPQAEPRKVERVTSVEAVQRKRGLGKRLKETFVGGDAKTAASYVAVAVVVPAIRDLVAESFHSWIDQVIMGDEKPGRRRGGVPTGYAGVGHVNYQRMSSGPPQSQAPGPGRMLSRASRTRHDFNDIVIQHRPEAEEVVSRLFDLLERYGSAEVADLYELTGIASSHTDHKWGWTDLRGARVRPIRGGKDGYLLELPEPQVFD